MFFTLSIIGVSLIIIFVFNVIIATDSALNILLALIIVTLFQFVIDGVLAFLNNQIPDKIVKNKKVFNVSKSERQFIEKLNIRKWKDKVWELGSLGGFSKASVEKPNDINYVDKFLCEIFKGEITHFFSMFIGYSAIFIFPYSIAITIPIATVNLFINLMSYIILRYNTPRLQTLKKYLEKQNNGLNT